VTVSIPASVDIFEVWTVARRANTSHPAGRCRPTCRAHDDATDAVDGIETGGQIAYVDGDPKADLAGANDLHKYACRSEEGDSEMRPEVVRGISTSLLDETAVSFVRTVIE
jgi:hypothetical protein